MNKTELIRAISDSAEISQKNTAAVIETMQDIIRTTVSDGEKVSISGFAVFEKKHIPAKSGVSKLGGAEKEWSTPEKDVIKVSLSKTYSNIE